MVEEKRMAAETTKGGPKRSSLEAENDRWKFLEEMDVPMWADLEAEAQGLQQDSGGAWFEVVHPFHQCSSKQILSYLHLLGVRNEDRLDGLSPKLPDSVSRSRGKHYEQKAWKEIMDLKLRTRRFSADRELFQHPIKALRSSKSLYSNAGNTHNTLAGDSTSKDSGKGSKHSSVTLKTMPDSQTDCVDKSCEKSVASRMSQPFPKSSGLLSAVRVSLRRSFLTGHASRVKIQDDEHLKGRKSSTSKSSIGSSATVRGAFGGGDPMTLSRKERTPQSRQISSSSSTSNGTTMVPRTSGATKTRISNQNLCSNPVFGSARNSKITDSRKPLQPHSLKVVVPKDRTIVQNPKPGACIKKSQAAKSSMSGKENAPKILSQSKKDPICGIVRKSQAAKSSTGGKENAPKILSQSKKDPICSVQRKDWRGETALKGKSNEGLRPHLVQGKKNLKDGTRNVRLLR